MSPVGDICEHRLALTRGITSFSSGSRAFVLSGRSLMDEGILRGVAQLVARTAGGREVAGSNPVVPTILHFYNTYAKII